jgi:hypothetical protein
MSTEQTSDREEPPMVAEKMNAALESAKKVLANLNKALASDDGESPTAPAEASESACRSEDKSG